VGDDNVIAFLAAKDHRITANDLNDMENEFRRLNIETSRSVLKFYRSRKNAARAESDPRRLPRFMCIEIAI